MRNSAGAVLGDLPLGTPLADGTPALTMKRSRFAVSWPTRRDVGGSGSTTAGGSSARSVRAHGRGALRGRHDRGGGPPRRGGRRPFRRPSDHRPGGAAGRYVGLTNFGGVTSAGDAPGVTIQPESWQFTFGRKAFFGAHGAPNGDIVWFVNAPRDEISR